MNVPVIGFSAHKQGGKSTAVKYLNDDSITGRVTYNMNFADELKVLVVRVFVPEGWNGKDNGTDPIAFCECHKNDILPCGKTLRQILQEVGCFFRQLDPNVWVRQWAMRVDWAEQFTNPAEGKALTLVGDVRFPNELKAIQDMGGKVIRFTRTPHPEDIHESETALDFVEDNTRLQERCSASNLMPVFDAVIDNTKMSIEEQNTAVWNLIQKRGWLR